MVRTLTAIGLALALGACGQGGSGNGAVSCKPGKKEKTYACSWSDSSGSGGVTFTVNAKGNLDGYWSGSGGGGSWTFNRAKAK